MTRLPGSGVWTNRGENKNHLWVQHGCSSGCLVPVSVPWPSPGRDRGREWVRNSCWHQAEPLKNILVLFMSSSRAHPVLEGCAGRISGRGEVQAEFSLPSVASGLPGEDVLSQMLTRGILMRSLGCNGALLKPLCMILQHPKGQGGPPAAPLPPLRSQPPSSLLRAVSR